MWRYRISIVAVSVVLVGCPSKQDVLNQTPLLDRTFKGDYQSAAACTLHGIQTADYTFAPTVQYIPVPQQGYVELQVTASSGYTGTIYGVIARFEDIDGSSFRSIIQAATVVDGDEAIEALMKCVNSGQL